VSNISDLEFKVSYKYSKKIIGIGSYIIPLNKIFVEIESLQILQGASSFIHQ